MENVGVGLGKYTIHGSYGCDASSLYGATFGGLFRNLPVKPYAPAPVHNSITVLLKSFLDGTYNDGILISSSKLINSLKDRK